MVDYNPTPYHRPDEQPRPHEPVRETTVVRTGNSTGAIAAIVLLIALALGALAYFSTDDATVQTPSNPAPEVNMQAAPEAAPVQPVPAPEAPAEIAPAAPADTAPAAEGNL